MHAVNVSTLKNNPTAALAWAQTQPVVVLNRSTPHALMLGAASLPGDTAANARMALAVSLFKDGGLSWLQAAAYAQCSSAQFMQHLSRLGLSVVEQNAPEVEHDMDTLATWLAA